MNFSLKQGKLAMPPWYDDSHSMVEGALRLMTFQQDGLIAAWEEYWNRFPHSFLHYYWTALVFSVAGIHDSAPYWANSLFIFLILICVWALLENIGFIQKIFLTSAFACVPVMFNIVYDYRSECALAPLLFAACAMVVLAVTTPRAKWLYLSLSGLFFALGFGFKPAMFPYTFGMLGAACLTWIVFHCPDKVEGSSTIWEWLNQKIVPVVFICVIAIGPFLFHYIHFSGPIIGYIKFNAFENDFYKQSGGLWERASYHLSGYPAILNLGIFKKPLLIIAFSGLVATLIFRKSGNPILTKNLHCLIFLTVISYFGIAINQMVQNYFCMTFVLLLVASASIAVAWAGSLFRWQISVIATCLIFLTAIYLWRVPAGQAYVNETNKSGSDALEWRKNAPYQVLSLILQETEPCNRPEIWVGAHGWLDGNTISWAALVKGIKIRAFSYYEKAVPEDNVPPDGMDFVILYPKETMGICDLPLNKSISDMMNRVKSMSESWKQVAKVSDPYGNKVLIFKNINPIRK
jgi:hypothetical protein